MTTGAAGAGEPTGVDGGRRATKPPLREPVLAFMEKHRGEVSLTRDIVRGIGIDPDNREHRAEYDRAVKTIERLWKERRIVRVNDVKGHYRIADTPTHKEARQLYANRPPMFHGIFVHADAPDGVSLSSVQEAEGFFRSSGGLLGTVAPYASGREAGNKTVWVVPLAEKRMLRVEAHAHGVDASLGCTDEPLTPGEVRMLAQVLHTFTGLPPDEWTLASWGVNADRDDVRLEGIKELRWTLGRFGDEVLRVYEHAGMGTRLEVHSKTPLSFESVLALVSGPSPLVTEEQVQRVERMNERLNEQLMRVGAYQKSLAAALDRVRRQETLSRKRTEALTATLARLEAHVPPAGQKVVRSLSDAVRSSPFRTFTASNGGR